MADLVVLDFDGTDTADIVLGKLRELRKEHLIDMLDAVVVIRPEDVQIVPPSVGMLTGLVREVIFKGVHFEMHVDVEGYEWLIHSTQASQPGELIGMNIGPDEIHIMKRSEV